MKLSIPKNIPAMIIVLPCDYCGKKETTVRLYLKYKSDCKNIGGVTNGFWPDLSILLCKECVSTALEAFKG